MALVSVVVVIADIPAATKMVARTLLLLVALLVVPAAADTTPTLNDGGDLTCKVGAYIKTDKTCSTSNMGASVYAAQKCTKAGHSCLTAKYFGDWLAAYGCYPDAQIEATKTL